LCASVFNRDFDADFSGAKDLHVVQVESVGLSVQLDSYVVCSCRIKDLFEIDRERLAFVDEPSGWMGQDIDSGIRESLEDSFGHVALVHVHFRMNGGDNHVQALEDAVRQIERSIR
jgi:hypothetical protein